MVIDKALNPDPKRKPEKAFKFASDFDKLKFDVEQNIIDSLREAYEQEKKKGQSFSDWLNTKDKDYLIRIWKSFKGLSLESVLGYRKCYIY